MKKTIRLAKAQEAVATMEGRGLPQSDMREAIRRGLVEYRVWFRKRFPKRHVKTDQGDPPLLRLDEAIQNMRILKDVEKMMNEGHLKIAARKRV